MSLLEVYSYVFFACLYKVSCSIETERNENPYQPTPENTVGAGGVLFLLFKLLQVFFFSPNMLSYIVRLEKRNVFDFLNSAVFS